MVNTLTDESQRGLPLSRSTVLPGLHALPAATIAQLEAAISARPDRGSYHSLFALRRLAPDAYRRVPEAIRATILADALAHVSFLNDWGYLEPGESLDGEAALAMLELGGHAMQALRPVLDDANLAWLFGTEESTLSRHYGYRRKDFAYRYLTLLAGGRPEFHPDPSHRDRAIEQFKNVLPATP